MKTQVRNILQSAEKEGIEKEFLIFRTSETFGFEKSVEKYIAQLIKFGFIEEDKGLLRWQK